MSKSFIKSAFQNAVYILFKKQVLNISNGGDYTKMNAYLN